MSKITKEINIIEMIKKYPETAQVLFNHGIHCVGCHAAAFETLEQGLIAHGLSEEEIKKIVKELNEIAEKTPFSEKGVTKTSEEKKE